MKLVLIENGLSDAEYCEPYAGGAAVALSLLYDEYVQRIHINDIDAGIYAFWSSVLGATEALCRRIRDEPVTMEQWTRQRSVLAASDPDPLDLAFATFFLNRTNRSGIIEGGVIGGQEQKGRWKLGARYNTPELILRIEKVARFRSRISLTNHDAATFLRRHISSLGERLLVYLDPPYYVKGSGLYTNFYEHDDHAEIAGLVQDLPQRWIVSYDDAQEVLQLYEGCNRIRYALSYSAADRYRGGEVMFFSDGLRVPAVYSPANLHAADVDQFRQSVAGCS